MEQISHFKSSILFAHMKNTMEVKSCLIYFIFSFELSQWIHYFYKKFQIPPAYPPNSIPLIQMSFEIHLMEIHKYIYPILCIVSNVNVMLDKKVS